MNRFGKALIDERPIGFTDIYGEDCDIPLNGQHSGAYRQAMYNRDYESLQQTLRNEAFEDSRLQIARVAISRQYVTILQVKGLMELFSFEQNKLYQCDLYNMTIFYKCRWYLTNSTMRR